MRKHQFFTIVTAVCLICTVINAIADQDLFVAMAARGRDKRKAYFFCSRRIESISMLGFPALKNANYTTIQDFPNDINLCEAKEVASTFATISEKAVLVRPNKSCFFTEQGYFLQEAGARMVAFSVDRYRNIIFDPAIHTVLINGFQVLEKDFDRIAKLDELTAFDAYDIPRVDPAVVLLWLTALFCLAIGMCWGIHLFVISIRRMTEDTYQLSNGKAEDKVQATTNITVIGAVSLSVMAVGMILLAYFYPVVITYIIYVLYTLGALGSITACIMSLMEILPRRLRAPFQRKLFKSTHPWLPTIKVNFLCSLPIAAVIVTAFYVLRFTANEAWIFQNMIGIALCLVFIANVRVEKFAVIVIIFGFFIIYDVFFVFITPYIDFFNKQPTTPSSTTTTAMDTLTTGASTTMFPNVTISSPETTTATITTTATTTSTITTTIPPPHTTPKPPSVMEYVALGLGTNGQLPIVFAYPYLFNHPDPCKVLTGFCILGLGDVLIPGLLGMHCAIFDFVKDRCRLPVYSIVFLVSYTLALLATFLALTFMDSAQPALLYIVPATMLSVLITALAKKELGDLIHSKTLKSVLICCRVEKRDAKDQNGIYKSDQISQIAKRVFKKIHGSREQTEGTTDIAL